MRTCNNSLMKQNGNHILLLIFAFLIPSYSRAAGDIVIPEGTIMTLQLSDTISTKNNQDGDAFKTLVLDPIKQGDRIVIPKGSSVAGSISRIIRPGRFGKKPVMNLIFQSINIPGHGEYQIAAVLEPAGEHPEGTVKGKSSSGSDAARVLIPTAAGAGIGGIAGGGKGAGIGAGIGAIIGFGAIFSTPGKELEIRRGTTLEISLQKPLIIPADTEGLAEKH
jgi:hypothetical protein